LIKRVLICFVLCYSWNLNGLPFDEYSIQNGILMTQSTKFPFCIDPHNQAFNWIKHYEKNNSLKILSFADIDYVVHLKSAIEYGQSVIFNDFENINLDLKDLLNSNFQCKYIYLKIFIISILNYKICMIANLFCVFNLNFFSEYI